MDALNLPAFDAKIAQRDGKHVIFDVIRRRYVALTPEEWVRQHFTHFLLEVKGYPQGLLANEIQISLNGTKKRCDTVLYRRDLPFALEMLDRVRDYALAELAAEQGERS